MSLIQDFTVGKYRNVVSLSSFYTFTGGALKSPPRRWIQANETRFVGTCIWNRISWIFPLFSIEIFDTFFSRPISSLIWDFILGKFTNVVLLSPSNTGTAEVLESQLWDILNSHERDQVHTFLWFYGFEHQHQPSLKKYLTTFYSECIRELLMRFAHLLR